MCVDKQVLRKLLAYHPNHGCIEEVSDSEASEEDIIRQNQAAYVEHMKQSNQPIEDSDSNRDILFDNTNFAMGAIGFDTKTEEVVEDYSQQPARNNELDHAIEGLP